MDGVRRTELDVAAETIVAIFDSGLLPKTPDTLRIMATAAQVDVSLIRHAWHRYQEDRFTKPSLRIANPEQPPPPDPPAPSGRLRWQKNDPVPGVRRCSACGDLAPAADFRVIHTGCDGGS